MNKRWAVAGAVAAIVTVGAGTTAGAEPKPSDKNVEAFICQGVPVDITTVGRIGYIGGVKYKAVYLAAVTPDGIFTKVWGGGRDINVPDAITCISAANDVLVVAVPA